MPDKRVERLTDWNSWSWIMTRGLQANSLLAPENQHSQRTAHSDSMLLVTTVRGRRGAASSGYKQSAQGIARLHGARQVRVLEERRHPEADGRPVLVGVVGEAPRPVQVVSGARVRVVHPVGAGRRARLVHVPPVLVAEALHLPSDRCRAISRCSMEPAALPCTWPANLRRDKQEVGLEAAIADKWQTVGHCRSC